MAEEVAVFSKEKAELILEVIDYLVKAGYILKSGQKGEVIEAVPQIYVQNNSGETIPAYGVMEVSGALDRYVYVRKTTENGAAWLINSHRSIPAGGYGICQTLPVMSVLGSIGVGSGGSYCRPTIGSWSITQTPANEGGVWALLGTGRQPGTVAISAALGFNIRWADALGGWSIDKTFNALKWQEVVGTTVCPPI